MKKYLLLLAMLLCTGLMNAEDVWLVVWQKSGEVATYHVDTNPRIKYQDAGFLVISDEVEIAYAESAVRKFTLAKDISSFEDGIKGVTEDGQRGSFGFSKARPGSTVSIYDMSGRKVGSHTVGDDGSLRYSLDGQPAGIYLIKTETTTIKIIKK